MDVIGSEELQMKKKKKKKNVKIDEDRCNLRSRRPVESCQALDLPPYGVIRVAHRDNPNKLPKTPHLVRSRKYSVWSI
jgi:hypothetical protein